MTLALVDKAAADTSVGVILHVGSGVGCFGGIEQVAVFVFVVFTTDNLYFVTGIVRRACEVVTVTFLGVTVVVGLKVTEGLVMVEALRVRVFVVVVMEVTSRNIQVSSTLDKGSTLYVLMIGVIVADTVTTRVSLRPSHHSRSDLPVGVN